MNTPRLPAIVSSHATAKRSAFGLPCPSLRAKMLTMSQTSAAAASSRPPGRSSQRLTRNAGSSAPNGAPPIASAAAPSAGSAASGVIARAKPRRAGREEEGQNDERRRQRCDQQDGTELLRQRAHCSARPAAGRPICRKAKNDCGANASRSATSARASATLSRLRAGAFFSCGLSPESAGASTR